MTEPLQFAFSKERLLVLMLCAVFASLLLFGAGIATGLLLYPAAAERQVASASNKAVPVAHPAAPAAPEASEVKQTAEPSDATPAGTEKLESGVMVDVASFQQRNKAANLAAMLKRQGFGPVHTGQYDAQGQTLYYVRVGPFHSWEEAARTASELDQSFDLHSSVIPAKSAS